MFALVVELPRWAFIGALNTIKEQVTSPADRLYRNKVLFLTIARCVKCRELTKHTAATDTSRGMGFSC